MFRMFLMEFMHIWKRWLTAPLLNWCCEIVLVKFPSTLNKMAACSTLHHGKSTFWTQNWRWMVQMIRLVNRVIFKVNRLYHFFLRGCSSCTCCVQCFWKIFGSQICKFARGLSSLKFRPTPAFMPSLDGQFHSLDIQANTSIPSNWWSIPCNSKTVKTTDNCPPGFC